jgi:hypothetical protein
MRKQPQTTKLKLEKEPFTYIAMFGPEVFRRKSFLSFKGSVEIRNIGKAAGSSNIGNRIFCIYQ